MTTNLGNTSIDELQGMGQETIKKFHRLNLFTILDLLFHLPLRYQNRNVIVPIHQVKSGDMVSIQGQIIQNEMGISSQKRRKNLVITIQDHSGTCTLRFFNFYKGMQERFKVGKKVKCFGEVKKGYQSIEMIHPDIEIISDLIQPETYHQLLHHSLTPIYPLTAGLNQRQIRQFINQALLKANSSNLPDIIPQKSNALSLVQALFYLHNPPVEADQEKLFHKIHPAQIRLAMEEIIAHQLSLLRLRQTIQVDQTQPIISNPSLITQFIDQLPFNLTNAQKKVTLEIESDLKQSKPMLRLVQGDVGSGKTVVAAIAILNAASCGFQSAFMAPTEILAEQHANNLRKWCEPFNIKVVLLSGSLKGKSRKNILNDIQQGIAQVVIGTHALFQDDVNYHALNLIIVDEQHRFGVEQRLRFKQKGQTLNPHQLMMTATPIPRTLAMVAYTDLDLSIIDELPPNRTPVTTLVFNENRRFQLIGRLNEIIGLNQQAYWVCTLIEESESLEVENAVNTVSSLQEQLPNARIGLVHGKMKATEKDSVMQQFKEHLLDILVATTVIEVGVDVPNASLMVIENSERLGLSQLHQLRGRVGRGNIASYCVLLYKNPLSYIGRIRLNTMKETCDGFKIAEKDLELRGSGEVLGTKQTGNVKFKIADLSIHSYLVARAKEVSSEMIANTSEDIINVLIERWIGQNDQYGNV